MKHCLVCGSQDVETILDFGEQPVSTHFMPARDAETPEHHLALSVCARCAVAQLSHPFPGADLVPRYDWITYREPEGHLDGMVERILRLDGIDTAAVIAGVTFKEATTLERLRERGVSNLWSIDPKTDLGATEAAAGAETVQARLDVARAAEIVARRGRANVVIARHVVEHAERPREFLQALGSMVADDGYLVIEVPDCRKNFERQDYTLVWEEHSLYLTPDTVIQVLPEGFVPVEIEVHPCAFEDLIVLYARKLNSSQGASRAGRPAIHSDIALARALGPSFETWSRRYRSLLERWTAGGRRVATYGAGHLTAAFVNLHGLADLVAFVVDDTPQKQGLFMPKSRLEIVPRARLLEAKIEHCLFGVSPNAEAKIMANNAEFIAAGGQFHSMFVDSPRSIRHACEAVLA